MSFPETKQAPQTPGRKTLGPADSWDSVYSASNPLECLGKSKPLATSPNLPACMVHWEGLPRHPRSSLFKSHAAPRTRRGIHCCSPPLWRPVGLSRRLPYCTLRADLHCCAYLSRAAPSALAPSLPRRAGTGGLNALSRNRSSAMVSSHAHIHVVYITSLSLSIYLYLYIYIYMVSPPQTKTYLFSL